MSTPRTPPKGRATPTDDYDNRIRVAIVEDHADYRAGLVHLFRRSRGFGCAGDYGSVEEAVDLMPEVDVVLMDIGLPGNSGIEGVSLIKRKYPAAIVIMFTVFDDDKNIFGAIRAGADGYLLKRTPPARIIQAVEDAVQGGMAMTPFVAAQVVAAFREGNAGSAIEEPLTVREQEVLRCIVQGMNYQAIADTLFISLDTVRNHIRHIYEKLHVHSKGEAATKAIRQGLI